MKQQVHKKGEHYIYTFRDRYEGRKKSFGVFIFLFETVKAGGVVIRNVSCVQFCLASAPQRRVTVKSNVIWFEINSFKKSGRFLNVPCIKGFEPYFARLTLLVLLFHPELKSCIFKAISQQVVCFTWPPTKGQDQPEIGIHGRRG